MKLALALLIAVHFWNARGVHVPCHPVAVSGADAIMGRDQYGLPNAMEADPATCRILISSEMPGLRYLEPDMYCSDVVHEVGHLAGLAHSPDGLMAAHTIAWTDEPWDCYHWKAFARGMGIKPRDARPHY